jgi:uroporphyrinogen decarboxylase
MSAAAMTSVERVLTALGHKEPDRVPFFLPATFQGAKDAGVSLRFFFSRPEMVAQAQVLWRKKCGHDFLSNFFYGPVEIEAWGGDVIFFDDGPPNSGEPFLRRFDDIPALRPPDPIECPALRKVLETTRLLKETGGGDALILGVVMSPFSVPVMQMGFDRYFELMAEAPALFDRLMAVNEEFCVAWANAQVEAGASAIVYFDPVSSPMIVPRETYLRTGHSVARRTISRIKAPTATHLASDRVLPIVDDVASTGTAIVSATVLEDLAVMKAACRGKLTVIGNLNGIEMRRWTAQDAEREVKKAIAAAGSGGGFVLSDNHGEIPYQVPEDVLLAIAEAVRNFGAYPRD